MVATVARQERATAPRAPAEPPRVPSANPFAEILAKRAAAPAAVPPAKSEAELIAEHIARKGVTRSVSFGEHQEAVDTLRALGTDVFRNGKRGLPWLVNGVPRSVAELYGFANKLRVERGLKPLKKPKETA